MTKFRVVYLPMKTRLRFLQVFGLLAVILASSCAPAAATQPPIEPTQTQIPPAAETATLPPSLTSDTSTPTDTLTPTVQALPTSRGPDLHATDPATVSLASGELQLVEFFRFT